ncbi:hypothetical protein V7075_22200, partial [Neobacillus drentensis]
MQIQVKRNYKKLNSPLFEFSFFLYSAYRELFGSDPQVNKVMNQAIADMEALGAEVYEVTIPNLSQVLAFSCLSSYEFKFHLNDYLASLGPNAP